MAVYRADLMGVVRRGRPPRGAGTGPAPSRGTHRAPLSDDVDVPLVQLQAVDRQAGHPVPRLISFRMAWARSDLGLDELRSTRKGFPSSFSSVMTRSSASR